MTNMIPTALASYDSAMFVAKQQNNLPQITKTKEAAQDFEAVFISEMMSHMFTDVKTDPMFGGGAGEDMFRSMLVTEYGKEMAKTDGIGIADQLQKVMIEMQQLDGEK